jgi:hypothetical protein
MKELEKEFIGRGEVRGFKFTLLYGNSRAFVYKVVNQGSEYYEVFRRKENTKYGVISYPSSKAFGIWAWYCSTLDKAMAKFNELSIPKP